MPNGKPRDMEDVFSYDGAKKLADTITAYWAERGQEVFAWVEEISAPIRIGLELARAAKTHAATPAKIYVVKSDMVAGFPPRVAWKMKVAA